jgi:hypothetical protein
MDCGQPPPARPVYRASGGQRAHGCPARVTHCFPSGYQPLTDPFD